MHALTHSRRSARCAVTSAVLLACLVSTGSAAQVALRRDLVIDGEFGFVGSLTADAQGRIYVADTQLQQVRVFDARGAALPAIGRNGGGPGEFRGLLSVVAGRGDTLFTFDVAQQRITAFAPGTPRRPAYTLPVPADGRTRAGTQLLVPGDGSFLLPYATPYGADAPGARRWVTLRTLARDGTLAPRPVLRSPDVQALTQRTGTRVTVGELPYGRAPFFALGPGDRLFHGWNDGPLVSVYDLSGRRLSTVDTRASTRPVRAAALRRLVDSYPVEGPSRGAMQAAIRAGDLPGTAPAYKGMVVDDRGRVWVSVLTDDDVAVAGELGLVYVSASGGRTAPTPWWVFDVSGRRVAVATLPADVRLWQVRGGRAYGIETDGDGVQRVVRYAVPF